MLAFRTGSQKIRAPRLSSTASDQIQGLQTPWLAKNFAPFLAPISRRVALGTEKLEFLFNRVLPQNLFVLFMHERGLIFSVYQTAKEVLHSDDTFERRCRAKTKLEGFRQTMFVVCLLLCPVKQVHAAFLDNFAVLALSV
jgi:hypothetical protein